MCKTAVHCVPYTTHFTLNICFCQLTFFTPQSNRYSYHTNRFIVCGPFIFMHIIKKGWALYSWWFNIEPKNEHLVYRRVWFTWYTFFQLFGFFFFKYIERTICDKWANPVAPDLITVGLHSNYSGRSTYQKTNTLK